MIYIYTVHMIAFSYFFDSIVGMAYTSNYPSDKVLICFQA